MGFEEGALEGAPASVTRWLYQHAEGRRDAMSGEATVQKTKGPETPSQGLRFNSVRAKRISGGLCRSVEQRLRSSMNR